VPHSTAPPLAIGDVHRNDETFWWRMIMIYYWMCRSQWPRGVRHRSMAARLLRSWVRIPQGHGCLSVVCVMCCQVEVSATNWSLIQRSPTDCSVSLCVIKKRRVTRRPKLALGCRAREIIRILLNVFMNEIVLVFRTSR
jgi:hypothetical protein